MEFDKFQPARLIPITGIKGGQDQERRATSALIAVMTAVPDYARAILKPIGAPSGKLRAYIEPEFELMGKRIRPDGLLSIERAGKQWNAIVEVKTGKNVLDPDQLNAYLDVAKSQKIDALITISNQVLTATREHPTQGLDARKAKATNLVHLSWIRLITEAMIQTEHKGVADPDQAWILSELVRFLQSDASGANEFDDMGPNWVAVREAVVNGTITARDPRLAEITQNFESLLRFVSFKLSARLGVNVVEVLPRKAKEDPKKHLAEAVASFVDSSCLSGTIRIPETASDITIRADLRAAQVMCEMSIRAPREGRNLTRINWLLRQLKGAPPHLRIEAYAKHGRHAESVELLSDALADPKILMSHGDREITEFRLVSIAKMGPKRGNGAGSFIESIVNVTESTYETVLQNLRVWSPKAPRLSSSVVDLIPEQDADGNLIDDDSQ